MGIEQHRNRFGPTKPVTEQLLRSAPEKKTGDEARATAASSPESIPTRRLTPATPPRKNRFYTPPYR